MKPFIARWAATTFAVFIAGGIIPGITVETGGALIMAGLVLGILNAVVRPVLLVLSLPLIVLSFGLIIPLINAILLNFVGSGMISGFQVRGFGSALGGAIVISVVSWGMNRVLRDKNASGIPTGTAMRPAPDRVAQESRPMKKVQGRVIE